MEDFEMFQVSDKVVCVDDSPSRNGVGKLTKGQVYVIRAIECHSYLNGWPAGTLGLILVGVECRLDEHGREVGMASCRFRKLSDIKAENAERAKKEEIIRNAFFSSPLNPCIDTSSRQA